jgi:hypothetical protein
MLLSDYTLAFRLTSFQGAASRPLEAFRGPVKPTQLQPSKPHFNFSVSQELESHRPSPETATDENFCAFPFDQTMLVDSPAIHPGTGNVPAYSFMPAIVLRMPRPAAFQINLQSHPPNRQPAQTKEHLRVRKRRAVVTANVRSQCSQRKLDPLIHRFILFQGIQDAYRSPSLAKYFLCSEPNRYPCSEPAPSGKHCFSEKLLFYKPSHFSCQFKVDLRRIFATLPVR